MYLLDTNALLFFLYDNEKLSKKASEIKSSISKIVETCKKEHLEILSIKPVHLDGIRKLPLIHGDPFDRLIISQALMENFIIITKDGIIPQYDVKVLW